MFQLVVFGSPFPRLILTVLLHHLHLALAFLGSHPDDVCSIIYRLQTNSPYPQAAQTLFFLGGNEGCDNARVSLGHTVQLLGKLYLFGEFTILQASGDFKGAMAGSYVVPKRPQWYAHPPPPPKMFHKQNGGCLWTLSNSSPPHSHFPSQGASINKASYLIP